MKCILCGVLIQNFCEISKLLFKNSQNFEPEHHKICILTLANYNVLRAMISRWNEISLGMCCNHQTGYHNLMTELNVTGKVLKPSETGYLNTLRPRQNGRHFADDIFKRIFVNENIIIPIRISLKFVPKGSINNSPALVQIMAWCRPGDKPSSEPMMVNLPTHICVTRPQWVNGRIKYNWECCNHQRRVILMAE